MKKLFVFAVLLFTIAACVPDREPPPSDKNPPHDASAMPTTPTVVFSASIEIPLQAMAPTDGPECDPFADYKGKKIWRAVEAEYPAGHDFTESPTEFADLVNPEVVKRAVKQYACRNRLYALKDQFNITLWGHDLSIVGASYYARMHSFIHAGIDPLAGDEKTWDAYQKETAKARDIVREHLKDQETLKREYKQYKHFIVFGLKHAQNPGKIKEYLSRVLPYFTEPISPDVLEKEATFRKTEEAFYSRENVAQKSPITPKDLQKLEHELIAATPDYRALQWMLRRKKEGGDELVHTWGEIFTDLHRSL